MLLAVIKAKVLWNEKAPKPLVEAQSKFVEMHFQKQIQ